MKAYGGLAKGVCLHLFFVSLLRGGKWSPLIPTELHVTRGTWSVCAGSFISFFVLLFKTDDSIGNTN